MTTESLQRRRDLALGAGAELFYDEPLEIVRGEGIYLFDRDGRRYVDMYNNVPCVGHANPAVVEAMAAQQATVNVHNRYLHEGIVAFAERLAGLHHDAIESVVFSCSGTEANEVAIQMARIVTGQRGIVCTDAAYHGNSDLVGALNGVGNGWHPRHDIHGFPTPDLYRPLAPDLDEPALCDAYLSHIEAAIEQLKRRGPGFAALILCPIFANEGLPEFPEGFLPKVTGLVHREGGLVIADEVQSGYARTGRWWGYETTGFRPDIVTTGKPMGNGLPLSATAASRDAVNAFRHGTGYFNTFASSPLQAAVGMAVLDEIERLDLLHNAAAVGGRLAGELEKRLPRYATIGDVRAYGLFIGVEMVTDKASKMPDRPMARRLSNRLKDAGFLVSYAGRSDNVLKLRPPLVFADEHADRFLEAFDACMAELDG
ncbi:MAG: aspartate aminotransferase family protein [Woeseiaceae bacterium]|jgi:4-aminobutyrate aminotransferase-like enzyme|nr:aspartate aminotransferase family protein [Woeseiaceae bacterium]